MKYSTKGSYRVNFRINNSHNNNNIHINNNNNNNNNFVPTFL